MRWRLTIIGLALVAAVVPLSEDFVEQAYSSGIYPLLQSGLTSSSNLTAVSLLDVMIVSVVLVWIGQLWRDLVRRRWTQVATRLALRTATVAAALYLLFLATWGLNYRRVPLEAKLEVDYRAVTPDAAANLATVSVVELNRLYPDRPSSDAASAGTVNPSLAGAFDAAQRRLGLTRTAVPARPKRTLLDPYFRAASVDGMTDPFFLETITLGGLLAVEQPMIVAHEWAHLAGYADEGEANFVGWLTCLAGDDAARYSAWLFLYAETASGLGPDVRVRLARQLASGPTEDLAAIARRVRNQVNPLVSAVGWRVYDQYLKANGVERGTRSYTDVVRLVLGTRLGTGVLPPLTAPAPARTDAAPAGTPPR